MPRPRVLEEYRQRIAKACLNCQAAKQKCDGRAPCTQCHKRGRSSTCAYQAHERLYGRRPRKPVETGPESASIDHAAIASSHGAQPSEIDGNEDSSCSATDVTVPKLPHNLYDTKGRVLYLGHCAALSFLQNIQELIDGEMRLATIAADFASVPVYEEVLPVPDDDILACSTTNIHDFEDLVDVFFASTGGIVDIFGRPYLEDLLAQWLSGCLETSSGGAAVLFLAIAYAAQARCATMMDVHRAQSYYNRGRQIALLELTNDPSLETVQAFILICLYMLACSRRNGAYLNLGIALSAAKSLGCHRDETNADFPESEGRLRKRIWRTLRYHDLFFCAMMGRTSAILTTDSTVLDEQLLVSDPNSLDFCQELGLLESARAFSFLERTVNEVYTKQTVPLGLLQQISQQLREASSKLPSELRTSAVSNSLAGARRRSQQHILRNASVACNYYFTMMILTRPFLITSLRAKCSQAMVSLSNINGRVNNFDAQVYTDITHGATTSIDSAIKTIRLLHEVMLADMLFNNMPLAVAWAFVAALTICSAYFGRLGVLEEYSHAIQQADEILHHFARNSPQAKRYSLILKKLSRAALDYVKRLEHSKEVIPQNTLIPELFRLDPTISADASKCTGVSIESAQSSKDHNKLSSAYQGNYSYLSQWQGSEGEALPTSSESIRPRVYNQTSNQAGASIMSNSGSLLDLANSFQSLNNMQLDMYLDPPGGSGSKYVFDFENTESLWDLNWEGTIL